MSGIRAILGALLLLGLGYATGTAAMAAPEGYLDVKSIGAKGDGVTDDGLLIAHALNLAKQRGVKGVYFPPGTYAHSNQLQVTSGANLLGAGSQSSVLLATGSADKLAIIVGAKDSTIAELGFKRQGAAIIQSGSCSAIATSTNTIIKNCSIGQGFRTGIYISGGGQPGSISQCNFEVGTGGTGLSITNLTAAGASLRVSDCRFTGVANSFGNGIELGKVAGIADAPVNRVTIEGNRFDGVDEAVHGERASNVVVQLNNIVPGSVNLHNAIEFSGGSGTANTSVDVRNNTIGLSSSPVYFNSGIVFTGGSSNSNINITFNTMTGLQNEGIVFQGSAANVDITNNKITGANKIALLVDVTSDSHHFKISENTVIGGFNHFLTYGAMLIRGGNHYLLSFNQIENMRGGTDQSASLSGGITVDASPSSYGSFEINSNHIKDVDLSGGSSFPPLAVIQINTANTFDKLRIVGNAYSGNTNGLGYFILCPDDTKVPNLIVAGNTTNTTLPTHIGPP